MVQQPVWQVAYKFHEIVIMTGWCSPNLIKNIRKHQATIHSVIFLLPVIFRIYHHKLLISSIFYCFISFIHADIQNNTSRNFIHLTTTCQWTYTQMFYNEAWNGKAELKSGEKRPKCYVTKAKMWKTCRNNKWTWISKAVQNSPPKTSTSMMTNKLK